MVRENINQFSSEVIYEPENEESDPQKMSLLRPARQINLLRGWPSPTLHPTQLLRRAADRVLAQTYDEPTPKASLASSSASSSRPLDYDSLALAEQAMLYGPDPGHLPLRKALGKWLWEFYGPSIRRKYSGCEDKFSHGASKQNGDAADVPPISYDRITITGGASQSMDVILSAVTDPTFTRKVWIVAPGYFMAFKIFRDAGFAAEGRMACVPEITFANEKGERGPDVEWLREKMQQSEREWKDCGGGALGPEFKPKPIYPKIYKHIIYTVPSFANPSSITTSLSVRENLVRCAREFDALVICDDVYDMLQWQVPQHDEGASSVSPGISGSARQGTELTSENEKLPDFAPLPRLVDVDRFLDRRWPMTSSQEQVTYGNVVSNGSFSKICGPGCRNGWVEAAPALAHLISQEGAQKSGGAPGQLVSTFLCDMLEHGDLQHHVKEVLRPAYAKRWAALVAAVREALGPLGVKMPAPHGSDGASNPAPGGAETERAGGYFVWLTLPDGLSQRKVSRRCLEEENLIVAGGRLFEVPGDKSPENSFENSIRLCFAWEAEEELVEGITRLGRVLRRELDDLKSHPRSSRDGEGKANAAADGDFRGFA